ncbi:MAG: hypothetical protein JU82_10185 [Sulfuricurvum sp. MLSB]|uniref:hypothetical protein n=1 Tax=unclassified Sulfuricurvum TaxID=2632390 RepID=UPI000504A80D|nr:MULTISPECIES: hypothetical protein [unclassified Sulfuricurvum]KFN38742.1 MAG: hypothetical protein JU82_10185 [Sulfuricurvum sp. MLSB]
MVSEQIVDNLDVFAERYKNIDLHGKKITISKMIDIRSNHLKGAIFSRYEAMFLLESMGIVLVD